MFLRKPLLVRVTITLLMAVMLASLTLIPTAASTQNLTFKPVADSYVDSANPTVTHGTATTLRTDASPVVNSYLRFTVSGVGGQPVSQARLLIYANSASSQGLVAKSVASNTWAEGTIDYDNAPAMGSTLATSPAVVSGTWVTLDVTAFVTGDGTFSFGVSTPGSTAISLASRESGANAPQLVVTVNNSSTPAPTNTLAKTTTPTSVVTLTKTPTLVGYSYQNINSWQSNGDKYSHIELQRSYFDQRPDLDLHRRQYQDESLLAMDVQCDVPGAVGHQHQLWTGQYCCHAHQYQHPPLYL